MSKFADYIQEDMRLVILRILNDMPSYTANSSVLYGVLPRYGHNPSRDQVKSEIRWMEEMRLVEVEIVSDLLVAKISERGADVAMGRAVVPGVKKPGA